VLGLGGEKIPLEISKGVEGPKGLCTLKNDKTKTVFQYTCDIRKNRGGGGNANSEGAREETRKWVNAFAAAEYPRHRRRQKKKKKVCEGQVSPKGIIKETGWKNTMKTVTTEKGVHKKGV